MPKPVHFTDGEIVAARPVKNAVDPSRPYSYIIEPERTAAGTVEDVATIFLTNRECPFRCLMCDLWKNTTNDRVPAGAIPSQIDFALQQLGPTPHVKLYNSGNFFDAQAVPLGDMPAIAERVDRFQTVIVENHPRLCSDRCVSFARRIGGRLEIAIGLETIHPTVLPALNKNMTLDDFDRAVEFLLRADIDVRAFILLKPPFLSEDEGVDWALRSIEHAFAIGVGCCSVIPTRAGNGIMDRLQQDGLFSAPHLSSLELVLSEAINVARRRVFVDLWDAARFATCSRCVGARIERLRQLNLTQQVLPPVVCDCGQAA